jgi:hypothetical protein
VGARHPVGTELGPERRDHESAAPGDGFHQCLEEHRAGRIDPLQVLDQHDARFPVRRLDQPADEVTQASVPGVSLHRDLRGVRRPDAEEVVDQLEVLGRAEVGLQGQQLSQDLVLGLGVGVGGSDPEAGPEHLQDRDERDLPCMGLALCLVHADAAVAALVGELLTQTALADTGRCHDADHLADAGQ